MINLQDRAVLAINELSDGLPKKGQLAVLEHLLENLSRKDLAKLPEETLAKLLEVLPIPKGNEMASVSSKLTTQPLCAAEQRRDAFIAKHAIEKLGSSQVALTLPEGITRIEFLKEAQALSIALHKSEPGNYKANKAVYPSRLESWESERGFTEVTEKQLFLRVDGNVKGSTNLNRKEQEDKGWNDVAIQDLAVAHTAFYLLTCKDLFENNVVRARGGALYFNSNGLGVSYCFDDYYDGYRSSDVSASGSLPAPN